MKTITDQILLTLGLPLDVRLSNITLTGSNIKVETLPEYLIRVDLNSRYLGLKINILSPSGTYNINDFIGKVSSGEITQEEYWFQESILDEGLVEYVSGGTSGDIPTKLSELENDTNFITLGDIPTIPSDISELTDTTEIIPTSTSDLTNDSGFIVGTNVPDNETDPVYTAEKDNLLLIDGSNSALESLTFIGIDQQSTEVPLTVSWNQNRGTWDWPFPEGVTGQMFQELYFYGKCTENINDGDVVMFAGAEGGHYLVSKAVPASINLLPKLLMGIATQSGTIGTFIRITNFGEVNNLNTTEYYSDDPTKQILFFDSNGAGNGKLTINQPIAPHAKIVVAAVVKHSTGDAANGTILVRPTFANKLLELQDVHIENIAESHIIVWNNSLFRWENRDALNQVSALTESSGSFQLGLSHVGSYVRVGYATDITVTIPLNATTAIPVNSVVTLIQTNTGVLTLAGETVGVTLNAYNSGLKTAGQYAAIQAIKVGTDEWDIIGGTA